MRFYLLIGCFLWLGTAGLQAADPFAEGVRTTDPLPAEEQQRTFKLPPGFEIQLVASEPDIQKPMNMAFDSKGRLWVSMSREYPFPAPLDKPARDSIRILEDFDGNGRAQKITTFADGLNIPIGLYPYKNGVIAWSIPNIWFFQDTDGDSKADQREVLFGPLGWERDTHGNQASFRRGFDGWLYLTHGYNNISTVRGKDGSEIKMHSGNTYRVRLDGSRVEQHTYGQVNPFGLCFDPAGNIYSADCHSAPIYELLRGAYYPSFGKPHDGLGFGPTLMEHSHGSTAICGIIFYADDRWPAEFQNNILIGNVMTSRINRDRLIEHGSTKRAHEEPDFLTTTDPWFRPVDLQLGPDGALYVGDFYNRIIGHYEVPLTHPGRDRERARIWRIVYKGKPLHPLTDFAQSTARELIEEFKSPNLFRRKLAMDELVDRIGNDATKSLQALMQSQSSPGEIVLGLWALHRLNHLPPNALAIAARHSDPLVRTHAMRVLSETTQWNEQQRQLALSGLNDQSAQVQRTAADALAQHAAKENIEPLLRVRHRVPKEDQQLLHAVRLALRNQLREGANYAVVPLSGLREDNARAVADVSLGVQSPEAANFLLDYVGRWSERPARVAEYIRHSARFIPSGRVAELGALVRKKFGNDSDQQLSFFRAIQEGSSQRGLALPDEIRSWGTELAGALLQTGNANGRTWRNFPIAGKPVDTNPWFLQKRESADGDKGSTFICSLPPGGEQLTGLLQSPAFTIPSKLTFYLAGHDGVPGQARQKNNLVRLIAPSGSQPIKETYAPRNDIAQKVEWDLSSVAGQRGQFVIADADAGNAYAWIAAGRFEPAVISMPEADPSRTAKRLKAAAEVAKSINAAELAPRLKQLLPDASLELDARAVLADAYVFLSPDEHRAALASLIGDGSAGVALRNHVCQALAQDDPRSEELLAEAMRISPSRVQLKLAQSLAGTDAGTQTLLAMINKGEASPRLLLDTVVKNKLSARSGSVRERVDKLTENLSPADEVAQKLIQEKLAAYNPSKAEPVAGAQVFSKNCAVCHQIDGNGGLVGPQLDGIGNRGLERILEDTLDPNRNVDVNFRTEIIVLKDSEVVTGLARREEGNLLIVADSTGKENSVRKEDIESRRVSDTSLMPANFADLMTADEFNHLLAFLLSKGPPAASQ